jgi:hypothetical protein
MDDNSQPLNNVSCHPLREGLQSIELSSIEASLSRCEVSTQEKRKKNEGEVMQSEQQKEGQS